jgi:hypothetical protein
MPDHPTAPDPAPGHAAASAIDQLLAADQPMVTVPPMTPEEARLYYAKCEAACSLTEAIDGALGIVHAAHMHLQKLLDLNAVEYTEGTTGADLSHHLRQAAISLRAAEAVHDATAIHYQK